MAIDLALPPFNKWLWRLSCSSSLIGQKTPSSSWCSKKVALQLLVLPLFVPLPAASDLPHDPAEHIGHELWPTGHLRVLACPPLCFLVLRVLSCFFQEFGMGRWLVGLVVGR